jgi:hypothetical protein
MNQQADRRLDEAIGGSLINVLLAFSLPAKSARCVAS